MNSIFRNLDEPNIIVDHDKDPAKHDSIEKRYGQETNFFKQDRHKFINFRKLEDWLISDWNHKRTHMNLPDLSFNPVRSGLYYSLRLGGTWTSADWWLNYFSVDSSFQYLRLEFLEEDINKDASDAIKPNQTIFFYPTRKQENRFRSSLR